MKIRLSDAEVELLMVIARDWIEGESERAFEEGDQEMVDNIECGIGALHLEKARRMREGGEEFEISAESAEGLYHVIDYFCEGPGEIIREQEEEKEMVKLKMAEDLLVRFAKLLGIIDEEEG